MNDEKSTLASNFQDYFTIELANTPVQKSEVYGVRYRVYCAEFGYESSDQFPDQEETDEFDEFSLHCLIRHKKSSQPAGCVRLVPALDTKNKRNLLPLELHCDASLDHEYIDSLKLDRTRVCEISRLAIDSLFRRRVGDEKTRFGDIDGLEISKKEQRTFSLIAIAAFLAATALTEISGKTSIFAMMEPFLPRMMKRSGIHFIKAGNDMDFRGVRAPYFTKTESVLENMHDDLKDLYLWIFQQIEEQYISINKP